MSDLHLEICDYVIPELNTDNETTLILAGDICPIVYIWQYADFFKRISKQFRYVIYVPGNHEYYHGNLMFEDSSAKDFLKVNGLNNIYYLNGGSVVIDGVAFIGATLWTNVDNNNPISAIDLENGLNDYRVISNRYTGRKLRTADTVEVFEHHKKFIFDEVGKYKNDGLKTVVISHHAPSELSVSDYFKGDRLNPGYFSNLDNEVIDSQPDIWIHGHMHSTFNYNIGDTNVICNPRGYAKVINFALYDAILNGDDVDLSEVYKQENRAFDHFLTFEI